MLEISVQDARNPRYTSSNTSIIEIEVNFSHLPDDWVWTSIIDGSDEDHIQELWDATANGDYGSVTNFVDIPFEERGNPLIYDLDLALDYVLGDRTRETKFLDAPELSDKNLFWKTIYSHTGLIDRTGTVAEWSGNNMVSIPATTSTANTVAQVCSGRVSEIVSNANSAGKDILLLWSGGIDSTTALAAFAEANTNISVTVNKANQAEYPEMYRKIVNGDFANITALNSDMFFASEIYEKFYVVDGDLGDQICGTHNVFADTSNVSQIRTGMLDNYTDQISSDVITSEIQSIIDAAPISITDTADFFWWLNFIFKYSFVNKRIPIAVESVDADTIANTEHFFGGDEWQRWAISNRTANKQFIVDNDRFKYKQPLKDYIYTVFQDANYRDYMCKKGSLVDDLSTCFKNRSSVISGYDEEIFLKGLMYPEDLS